jgi:hypothetical protein
MKRRVFNVLAGVSLVLCVVTVGLWVRSLDHAEMIQFRSVPKPKEHRFFELGWYDGRIDVDICRLPDLNWIPKQPDLGWRFPQETEEWSNSFWNPYGFHFGVGNPSNFGLAFHAGLRFWQATVLLLMLPSIWLITGPDRRNRQSGLCSNCGYDLRATPDRCPECGEVPKKTDRVSA